MVPFVTQGVAAPVLQGLVPRGTRIVVFERIYWVFLFLGTLVGVVVVGYMLYNAYRYRASRAVERSEESDVDRPSLGELPTGGGGGRKLFLSFGLSAVIVVSLITWTYFTLLYVEESPESEAPVEVKVVGHRFYWEFVYANGYTTQNTLRIPADRRVRLVVTSEDVFHNFGVPELKAKADAIPGQRTDTWLVAPEPGEYRAHCYELCGSGHSYMDATVVAMEPDEYRRWYERTASANATGENATAAVAGRVAAP